MLQPIIENTYFVEINIGTPSTQKRINFQFIPQLEASEIYSIQSFSSNLFTISPNGLAVASAAGCTGVTVTFCVGDDEKLYIIPITDLNSSVNSGFQRLFANLKINLTKSYITIQDPSNLAANNAICFQFIYRNKK